MMEAYECSEPPAECPMLSNDTNDTPLAKEFAFLASIVYYSLCGAPPRWANREPPKLDPADPVDRSMLFLYLSAISNAYCCVCPLRGWCRWVNSMKRMLSSRRPRRL